jgi:hypothetical protein
MTHQRCTQWLVCLLTLLLLTAAVSAVHAQTFTVAHNFTGGADGANPQAGLTFDRAGNLYGITYNGVFQLAHSGNGWVLQPLHQFTGGNDGELPQGELAIGADGSLYGVTLIGGGNGCIDGTGCGIVYSVKPPTTPCKSALCPWTETIIHNFQGAPTDGWTAAAGPVFDQAANLYGTTLDGGVYNWGAVYELTSTNGGWTEKVLYSFDCCASGWAPSSALTFDAAGNIYGTTQDRGGDGYYCLQQGCGKVYELMPSGSAWIEKVLHAFSDGSGGLSPLGGLTFDQAGNLYGTTGYSGSGSGGTVFELSRSNGNWNFNLLASLSGVGYPYQGPTGSLVMDAAGNLYGTAYGDGVFQRGSVFKLVPSDGEWTYVSLHDFSGGADGAYPLGRVILDANGTVYGTASEGGLGCEHGCGVVWKIIP